VPILRASASNVDIELTATAATADDDDGGVSARPVIHYRHLWCCNALTDTDDLILQHERDRANDYTAADGPLPWWMAAGIDIMLGLAAYKRPKACGCSTSAVGDAFLRVIWVLYMIYHLFLWTVLINRKFLGRLTCQEQDATAATTFELVPPQKSYRCPCVQDILANVTNGSGVQADISALLSTDPSYEEDWKRGGGSTDLIANYLAWKAETKSIVPGLFSLLWRFALPLSILACILTFSQYFHDYHLAEILFPAALQKKQATKTEDSLDNGNRGGILSRYHLVRMRKPILEATYSFGFVAIACMLASIIYIGPEVQGFEAFLILPGIIGWVLVLNALLCGIGAHVYNSTFLANVLVRDVLPSEPHQVQKQFSE
jgi:hypothetical protein